MLEKLSYDGFFNHYTVVGDKGDERLFIYAPNTLKLGDVYYGIVRSFDANQKAYFVNVGKDGDIYVKASKVPEHIKAGSGMFVQVTCEQIKTKPAAGKYYIDKALNTHHFRVPTLIKRAYDNDIYNGGDLSAVQKFKSKKFKNRLYHKFDFLALLKNQLSNLHYAKSGAELIVDELESLTAIDVNIGHYKTKTKSDSFAFGLNKSCISDIFNLLDIRRISGTVVIDFLNMSKNLESEFLVILKSHLVGANYTYLGNISIKGFTKTRLLELSIQKKYKSLWSSTVVKDGMGYRIKESIHIDLALDKFSVMDLNEGKTTHQLTLTPELYKSISDNRTAFDDFIGDMAIDLHK